MIDFVLQEDPIDNYAHVTYDDLSIVQKTVNCVLNHVHESFVFPQKFYISYFDSQMDLK